MSFLKPVNSVLTTKLDATTATVAASTEVMSRLRTGRHALEITALDAVYIGDKDVTSTNGRPIKVDETVFIPVNSVDFDQVYVVGGECIITEYF